MKFQYDEHELAAAIGGGYVKRTKHPTADLFIYNYTPQCQFEGTWTDLTRACRGLILDGGDHIVARPFSKFFNYGEVNLGYFPEPIEVTEKMDGSLGILYWLDGEPFIATRGSFTSEQAIEGTKMFREWWDTVESPTIVRQMTGFNNMRAKTFLYEILYAENRIVVDYGVSRRLVLLAVIDNETGLDLRLPTWHPDVVKRYPYSTLEAVLAAEQLPGHIREGFVVKFADNTRVKIKSDDYVRLHRIMTGLNPNHIWEIVAVQSCVSGWTHTSPQQWATQLGVDPARAEEILALSDDWLSDVPDEFYQWVQSTRDELWLAYAALKAEAEEVVHYRPAASRKQVAEYFGQSGVDTRLLFLIYDGKNYEPHLWKLIRPPSAVALTSSTWFQRCDESSNTSL